MESYNLYYLLAGVLGFVVVLTLNVHRHYKLWLAVISAPDAGSKVAINHKKETLIRALWVTPVIILLYLAKHTGFQNSVIEDLFLTVFCVASLWWVLFDGFFNIIRNFPWWFTGTVDKDESVLDNLKRKLGPAGMKIVQIITAVIGTVFYALL